MPTTASGPSPAEPTPHSADNGLAAAGDPLLFADRFAAAGADAGLSGSDLARELADKAALVARLEATVAALQARIAALPNTERLALLERELASYKEAKRVADVQIVETRALLKDAVQTQSFPFQLGKLLVEAVTSRGGLFRLCSGLFSLWRDPRARSMRKKPKATLQLDGMRPADQARELALLRRQTAASGAGGAAQWVRRRRLNRRLASRLLVEIAQEARADDPGLAASLATEAIQLNRSESRAKWVALVLAEAGEITQAAQLMHETIRAGCQLNGTERRVFDETFALERLLTTRPAFPAAGRRPPRDPRRILLLAGQALPWHWSAASLRLHAMALRIRATGREPVVLSLPTPSRPAGEEREARRDVVLDGVAYARLSAPAATAAVAEAFTVETAPLVAAFGRERETDLIQADGGITAGPMALTAGRALDLPVVLMFHRDEGLPRRARLWAENSEAARLVLDFERRLMAQADASIVYDPSRIRSAGRGSAPPGLTLLDAFGWPGGDAARPAASGRPAAGRPVIGFVGEESEEFNLASLWELFTGLPGEPGLVVAGVGRGLDAIRGAAAERGVTDRVTVTRRPGCAGLFDALDALDVFVAPFAGRTMPASPPFFISLALTRELPVVVPDLPFTRKWHEDGLPIVIGSGEGAAGLGEAVLPLLQSAERRAACRAAARARRMAQAALTIDTAPLDRLYRSFALTDAA